jgi:hypothetical protein
MTTYTLVEGWTSPIDCILLADGVAISLQGVTVDLLAYANTRNQLNVLGTVSVVDADAGIVRYTPTADDVLLLASNSPISVRWELTDSNGIKYVPNGLLDRWVINKP